MSESTRQVQTFDVKRLHHRKNVIPQVVRQIIAAGRCGVALCAKTSSRNAVDMLLPGEPRSEAVEAMRGISNPGEEVGSSTFGVVSKVQLNDPRVGELTARLNF